MILNVYDSNRKAVLLACLVLQFMVILIVIFVIINLLVGVDQTQLPIKLNKWFR